MKMRRLCGRKNPASAHTSVTQRPGRGELILSLVGMSQHALRLASSKGGRGETGDGTDNVLTNMAERTGLEPATPGVTGRYSNQLNYRSEETYVVGVAGIEPATFGL